MPTPRPTLTLAVIGHVNHGKTALVRALTGIETDRLKEEKARGLSITLGFAWKALPSGLVDLIDAPGHEDFIRAMVSGAAGARAVLLVVSAVEGVARQTREHLQIAGLLGLRHGLVAMTKSDLVPAEDLPAARARIAAELRGTALEGAEVLPCSAVSGDGLAALESALDRLIGEVPPPPALPGAFLPIDRAFTVPGAGTVVTGTLQGADIAVGDELVLQPSGRKTGVRQLQIHGEAADAASPVARVAVNLRGVQPDETPAGETLCAPDAFAPTRQADVEITLSAAAVRPLRHMDQVRVLWGARQDMARVRLFGVRQIPPGGRGLAQLRFDAPTVAWTGQPAILRRPSPAETLGGARVLDPLAPAARGRAGDHLALLQSAAAADFDALAAVLAAQGRGPVALSELARLCALTPDQVRLRLGEDYEALDGDRVVRRDAAVRAAEEILAQLAAAHARSPVRARVPVAAVRAGLRRRWADDLVAVVERRLAQSGEIRLQGGHVALAGHDPFAALTPVRRERLAHLEAALLAGGASPPDPAVLVAEDPADRELLDLLIDLDRAIALRNVALRQTLVFHIDALAAAAGRLGDAFPPPTEFATGEARAALATSRKFIVPMLEHFDDLGWTRRQGDLRRMTALAPTGGFSVDQSERPL